ncbi:MAG TPA: hypothetical protein VN247_08390 [Arenimonas sp.]|nr:hypothetical protein [Arenimonas sp.]
MELYNTLDAIADSINPGLAFFALVQLLYMTIKREWYVARVYLSRLLALTTVIYGWMIIDRLVFDFPYSTHSAFAICFCILHTFYMPRFKLVWIGTLIAYLALIVFQGYHSLLDIAVTLLLVVPFIVMIFKLPRRIETVTE